MTLFIESLHPFTWFFSVFPRIASRRWQGESIEAVIFFDGPVGFLGVAAFTCRLIGIPKAEFLPFRLIDVLDEEGNLVEERIRFFDLFEVQDVAMRSSLFNRIEPRLTPTLGVYLRKSIAIAIRKKIFLVQLVHWWRKRNGGDSKTVLFLNRQPFLGSLQSYAAGYGLKIIPVMGVLTLKQQLQSIFGANGIAFLQILRTVWRTRFLGGSPKPSSNNTPRLGIQSYGHLNLDNPERNSDLFFWEKSKLAPGDGIVAFGIPSDPLTRSKHETLRSAGFASVAMHPGAIGDARLPVWRPRLFHVANPSFLKEGKRDAESQWLASEIRRYEINKRNWADFFSRHKIKVYLSWFRFDAGHCVWTEAMESVGGVSCLYQKAHQSLPSPITTISTDILFAFSKAGRAIEAASYSHIRYHVVTGFLGDDRWPLLKPLAQKIREKLQENGARKIIAFYDENSIDDERWHSGHGIQRESYQFILGKLLRHPDMGLVIKPKVPHSLRHRLGPVAGLLKEAEVTGRCHVIEEGAFSSAYPPAVAALAADLAIHNCLAAGSAGIEAALSGTPTLLMDREGWNKSPLVRLGPKVAFHDWEALWNASEEFFRDPGMAHGVGDWSALIQDFDPFRDGRATERMGLYLNWLLNAFKAGKNREAAMVEAAERYITQWGADTVVEINRDVISPIRRNVRENSPTLA